MRRFFKKQKISAINRDPPLETVLYQILSAQDQLVDEADAAEAAMQVSRVTILLDRHAGERSQCEDNMFFVLLSITHPGIKHRTMYE